MKFSLRKNFFRSLLLFIGLNCAMMIGFFAFVFFPSITRIDKKSTEYLQEELSFIRNNLNEKEKIQSFFDNLTKNNKIQVKLRDENNNIIYDNIGHSDLIAFNELIEIDGEYYLIAILNDYNGRLGSSILLKYIIFQIVVFTIVSIPFMLFSNKRFLKPVDNIVKDMRDYKFGIKPQKREVVTGLDKIQNEFVDLVDNLEEEKGKQNRIIASISHDIKTPLTTIIGYTGRLENKALSDEEKKKYFEKIYNKSLIMKDIIESFDDYLSHNIEGELKTEVIFVNELLNKIKEGFTDDLKEKNIDLIIDLDNIEEIIKVDVSKIMRIFSNIIGNSVRYIENSGLIKITVQKQGGNIIFTINDNGGGIDDSIKEQLFEPLFTTDKSRKLSGLGLSICKEIVEVHGGHIEAFNENDGLSVRFSIPIYS